MEQIMKLWSGIISVHQIQKPAYKEVYSVTAVARV